MASFEACLTKCGFLSLETLPLSPIIDFVSSSMCTVGYAVSQWV